jgi:hypothetical protein
MVLMWIKATLHLLLRFRDLAELIVDRPAPAYGLAQSRTQNTRVEGNDMSGYNFNPHNTYACNVRLKKSTCIVRASQEQAPIFLLPAANFLARKRHMPVI